MRYCPRCTYPLSNVQYNDTELDHCYRCGGTFLDNGEVAATLGDLADPEQWKSQMLPRPPMPSSLRCPAGHGQMTSFLMNWNGVAVEVDMCPGCRGLWLDAWEGQRLGQIAAMMQGAPGATPADIDREPGGGATKSVGGFALYVVQAFTGIPIEVWNPVKRKPVVTYGLVALLTAIFVVEVTLRANGHAAGEAFVRTWGLVPRNVMAGFNLQGLVTYAFLHGGIEHIVGNLYFLWIFGDNVEVRLGRVRFTALFLVAALAGGLAHLLGNVHSDTVMVGASGAIAGMMGAYMVLFPRMKVWVVFLFVRFKLAVYWYMLLWIGMNVLIPLQGGSNVAWLAHMGGFVVGALMALALKGTAPPGRAAASRLAVSTPTG